MVCGSSTSLLPLQKWHVPKWGPGPGVGGRDRKQLCRPRSYCCSNQFGLLLRQVTAAAWTPPAPLSLVIVRCPYLSAGMTYRWSGPLHRPSHVSTELQRDCLVIPSAAQWLQAKFYNIPVPFVTSDPVILNCLLRRIDISFGICLGYEVLFPSSTALESSSSLRG